MKKIASQLLLLIPLVLFAGAVAAYNAPTSSAPNNNTDAPIDITSTAQVKNGGLSVGVFQAGNAGGGALLNQQSMFHGMIRGGTPTDVNSSISFGTVANAVNVAVNGLMTATGTVQSDSLKTPTGQQRVCGSSDGTFYLCGGVSAGNNDKYLFSSGGETVQSVDNLGDGHCNAGYTIFRLETGTAHANEITGFTDPHLFVRDVWPNLLGMNQPDAMAAYTPDAAGDTTAGVLDVVVRPNADITQYNADTLALTAPTTGTYDFKYKSSGSLQMLLDNGKKASDNHTMGVVTFYLSVKRVNGTQENYPMAPLSAACAPAYTKIVPGFGPANFFLSNYGTEDAGTLCGQVQSFSTIGNSAYHADSDYNIDFSKTLTLQQGDRVYLYGLSSGLAYLNGGGLNIGNDSCKPFKFTVDSKITIFDVTLHQ